ncbi:MAG: folate-binding protein YgfZ [Herminiimonas sp.]|nr:folate-binding protein YgfZ [Herminiimonas sp.]
MISGIDIYTEFMTEITNEWLHFLVGHGAHVTESATPEVSGFGNDASGNVSDTGFVAPLTDLGLIAASGEDAAQFLHNQLTNDVEHLGLAQARLAGYCSPKGRLLATLLMWKSADAIMLQLPREIQAPVQKRLQMFVLRAKAKLADATDSHVMLGLCGPSAAVALAEYFAAMPAAPYAKAESDAGTLIRMADAGGAQRYQWITTVDTAQNAWPGLIRTLQPVGARVWRLTDIEAGIPRITQATQDQFVPQMINYEVIGGVNFKKGCYPGQEIVARSQYLGKLKRRMMPASTDAQDVRAGMEVFSSIDPEQPCGMIVNAESRSPNQTDCLVEIKTASLEQGKIHLGSAGGPALQFKPLPYPLFDPT